MTNHAIDKACQRYNQNLNFHDLSCIVKKINLNESIPLTHLETEAPYLSFHFVEYNNIPLKVLFCKARRKKAAQIITIYPLDVDEYNEIIELNRLKEINNAISFLESKGYVVYKNWRK